MIRQTHKSNLLTALLATSLLFAVGIPSGWTAGENVPPPTKDEVPKTEFFEGKIAELDAEAKWLKVGETKYLIGDKTKIMNKDKEIKLGDLKVGTDIHGLAKKTDAGQYEATIVKVGVKPHEQPGREK